MVEGIGAAWVLLIIRQMFSAIYLEILVWNYISREIGTGTSVHCYHGIEYTRHEIVYSRVRSSTNDVGELLLYLYLSLYWNGSLRSIASIVSVLAMPVRRIHLLDNL